MACARKTHKSTPLTSQNLDPPLFSYKNIDNTFFHYDGTKDRDVTTLHLWRLYAFFSLKCIYHHIGDLLNIWSSSRTAAQKLDPWTWENWTEALDPPTVSKTPNA